jgi:hypothetical protein
MAAAAGCGGGSSPEDPRAELRRWRAAVDDVCRTTRERIAARGDARDALDLESVAARASEDVRAAIKRIRGIPVSATNRRRVRPFLAELEKAEPQLSAMTRTTADGSLKQIGRLALRLADATKRFQDRADAAGLHECADTRQYDAVFDAFAAPVYATQIAGVEIWLARTLRPLRTSPSPASPGYARYLHRLGRVFQRAEERIDDLYEYCPHRAVEASDDVHFALDDLESFLDQVADSLHGGRRILTPKGVNQFERQFSRLQRKVGRTIEELKTAIGAEPLVVPGAQSLESEEEAA